MNARKNVRLIECPRDAMQGWKRFVPTDQKIEYLNALLKVGFDTLDFGSFVSPKAIPQLADTREVLAGLDPSSTALLAIVANVRGAEEAARHQRIRYIGFPFSVSETFQQRNTNSSIAESIETVRTMVEIGTGAKQELVVYLSMGFGNPYGDPWSNDIVLDWAKQLADIGVTILSLADTVGLATPPQVLELSGWLRRQLPEQEIGVHLHSSMYNWREKAEAAVQAGVLRMDGALKGVGGCPMANDVLVGNMDTELLIPLLEEKTLLTGIDHGALDLASRMASKIFF